MPFHALNDHVTRFRRSTLNFAFHSAARLAELTPRVAKVMESCRLIEDIAYAGPGSARQQRLDILQPRTPGTYPIVVYIHGGAFTTCSKRSHRAVAAAYASRGYLVFNIDYRLAPRHPYPAALEDAVAAYKWVVEHAEAYNGDPTRIAIAGESAGASLALSLILALYTQRREAFAEGLWQSRTKPVAALLYCGFLQVSQPERYRSKVIAGMAESLVRDIGKAYLGHLAGEPTSQAALADPLCIVEKMQQATLPSIFIAAGTADPVCEDSERLAAALRRLGSPHVAKFYSGEPHAFHLMPWTKHALACWGDTFKFLAHCMGP